MTKPKNPRQPLAVTFSGRSEEQLLELIEGEDFSLAKIAAMWSCTKAQLQQWIDSDGGRQLRVAIARERAADWCDRQAEQVLLALRSDATAGDIARARELSQFYRWRARVRCPTRYGERLSVDHSVTIPLEQMSDSQLAQMAAKCGIVIDSERLVIEGRALFLDVDDAAPRDNP